MQSMDCLLFLCFALFSIIEIDSQVVIEKSHTFEIDYNNSQFLKDGVPFTYVAGEMHYFRIPRMYWKDRLHKLKAVGANTLQMYIEWSQHEPSPNSFRFDGQYDVAHFIRLAQSEGLYVIIRPGPYICAEREFGGYPAWILTMNSKVKLRTADPSHTFFVARYFRHLMPQLTPLLYGNGGPIIMAQVENEYGSYPVNDKNYLAWLRDLFRSYIKDAAVLFTTDGAGTSYITRGSIPGVFATIDFGPSSHDVLQTFEPLKAVQPVGPLVNSEYYVGWLSYWGQTFTTISIPPVIHTMENMILNNVSFSMYMFHGGTSFGFSAGSGSDKHFQADLTSYDYDAPISEAGDITPKYLAIQKLLSKYFPVETITPEVANKGDYGKLTLDPIISLFESDIHKEYLITEYPITFEQLDQSFGFVSYESEIITNSMDPSVLQVNQRDRAIIYLNDVQVGVLMYTVINELPLPPTLEKGQSLRILVENMGRRNFQLMSDCTKGIISNATIDGVIQRFWNITGYPLSTNDIHQIDKREKQSKVNFPAFFGNKFQINETEQPLDTFLNMTGWGKGVAFINGNNLGRYWHIGPQATLYVPASFLKPYPDWNTVTVLELHFTNPLSTINFSTTPILNQTVS